MEPSHGAGRGKSTDLLYIVASPEFWDSIPQTRQLTCGRVRFATERIIPKAELGASSYIFKAEAILHMKAGELLVRETQLDSIRWHYQRLL